MQSTVLWVTQDLRNSLAEALELTGTQSREVWKPFWSTQQRFFKLLCISMKVTSYFTFCPVRPDCASHTPPPSISCLH